MRSFYSAPWHRASYDRFISETLPELLAARLPVAGYSAEQVDDYTNRVTVSIEQNGSEFDVVYDILSPDDEGLFLVDGKPRVVVPLASSAYLDKAEIKCVGEQLFELIDTRMGAAGRETAPLDEDFVRTILPLDAWVRGVVMSSPGDVDTWATGQQQDTTNWLAARTHLRRVVIKDIEDVITPSQFGRVCPYETPEGPNIGHVFSVALGAEIRDGRFVVVDDQPEMGLGLSASTVPFIEYNAPIHQLMGVNMLRQWIPPLNPEPAIVRTGREPDVPEMWCGHNLLTAFVFWGPETYEDSVLISESCAKRMRYETPVEPGDKFSNRHGAKGCISRIAPDREMPHLADGTAVELVFSFSGIHTRLNLGQLREAVMSRIAKAEGEPAVVPPFGAPPEDELKARLAAAGLPENGMESLTMGKDGPRMPRPSTVGWVYWGRTAHIAARKLHYGTHPGEPLNSHGEQEYYALRDVGAWATISEAFNLRSIDREGSAALADRVAKGDVTLPGPTTPMFDRVKRHLAATGIEAEFAGDRVGFRFAPVSGEKMELAGPVRHPWLRGRKISELGVVSELPEYQTLAETNDRLRKLLASKAPETLKKRLKETMQEQVEDYLSALVSPELMRFRSEILFSGRTVLTPSIDLRLDQVGLPEEMAWALFGPILAEKSGPETERELDELMAKSWVIINRAPTFMATCMLAFRPVRVPGRSIRLHQLALMLLNSDYDGDQAAVFLPITREGQREAGELLSVKGHLKRDHSLIRLICPANEGVWGLAELSRTPEGWREICDIVGVKVSAPDGFVDRTKLIDALAEVLERDGEEAAIRACETLARRGYEVCKASGASLNAFAGDSFTVPMDSESRAAEVTERIESSSDYDSADLGPQILAVKSKARGNVQRLRMLVGPVGESRDAAGEVVYIEHGYRDGLRPNELFAELAGTRRNMARMVADTAHIQSAYGVPDYQRPQGYGVLARAMRSQSPGLVFVNAAANSEADPLTDLDSRLFVGLMP